mmetsp:Transcript_114242/g.328201  ORF Transcript_114242/g.328201 Transcript_114242/m.328201 type:complete len:166 (+) Transcript_114242:105-602(+)
MIAARTGSVRILGSAGRNLETNGARESRRGKVDAGAAPARPDALAVIARFMQSRQPSPAAAAQVRGHLSQNVPHLIGSRGFAADQAGGSMYKSSGLSVIPEADGGGDVIAQRQPRPSLYADFGDRGVVACAGSRTSSGAEWDVSLWMDVAEDELPPRAPKRAPVF